MNPTLPISLLLVFATASLVTGQKIIVGGWGDRNASDPQFLAMLRGSLAVNAVNKLRLSNKVLVATSVISVKTQVVAGIKYAIRANYQESMCNIGAHGCFSFANRNGKKFVVDVTILNAVNGQNTATAVQVKGGVVQPSTGGVTGGIVSQNASDPQYLAMLKSIAAGDAVTQTQLSMNVVVPTSVISVTTQVVIGVQYKIRANFQETKCPLGVAMSSCPYVADPNGRKFVIDVAILSPPGGAEQTATAVLVTELPQTATAAPIALTGVVQPSTGVRAIGAATVQKAGVITGGAVQQNASDPQYLTMLKAIVVRNATDRLQLSNKFLLPTSVISVSTQVVSGTNYFIRANFQESFCGNGITGCRYIPNPNGKQFVLDVAIFVPLGNGTQTATAMLVPAEVQAATLVKATATAVATGGLVAQDPTDPQYMTWLNTQAVRDSTTQLNLSTKLLIPISVVSVSTQVVNGVNYFIRANFQDSLCGIGGMTGCRYVANSNGKKFVIDVTIFKPIGNGAQSATAFLVTNVLSAPITAVQTPTVVKTPVVTGGIVEHDPTAQ